ncbi:MAG: class I SAM-dependent methyltransferase [Bacteroidota bacterium]
MQPQAFDSYAINYDDHFTNSLIGKTQREQVRKQLSRAIKNNVKSVLEINCGTGEDALWFSRKGLKVLATDISEGMIEVAKQKTNDIEFRQLNCVNIGSLPKGNYDLIFSNFGGLNCLNANELIQFRRACDVLQNKGNRLAFVIMGTQCWWERIYFKSKKDKDRSTRRQNKKGVETIINGEKFKTYYYSPEYFVELFGDDYDYVISKPIGLFVPPSYLEPYFVKRKFLLGALRVLDRIFSFSFFSNYADHYLIVFEKK